MRIALLSTSDTDLLSARASGADYVARQPGATRPPVVAEVDRGLRPRRRPAPRLAAGPVPGFRRVAATGMPVVVLGGEQTPERRADGAVDGADRRRRRGAPLPRRGRARQPRASCTPSSPTRCCSPARGSSRRRSLPQWGCCRAGPTLADRRARLPRIGVLFYRAHEASGNTAFAHALADAVDATGEAVGVADLRRRRCAPRPTSCSTRSAPSTRSSSPCSPPAAACRPTASAGGDDEAWDVGADGGPRHPGPAGAVPDQRAARSGRRPTTASPRSTRRPRSRSRSSTAGSSPRRSRSRRSTPTGCRATSPTPSAAPASRGSRSRTPGCARSRTPRRRLALVLSAYPTKHAAHRQRRRPRHPGLGGPAAARAARRGLRPRRRTIPVVEILDGTTTPRPATR